MDQLKIGKFIAMLRRQAGLTQQSLGEKIGVTNKTISRWENGNYMPDIEMLQLLSKEFNVSINELLAGEKIPDEEFRQKADENIIAVSKESAFSFEERKTYFKKKWRKEHISLFVILGLILLLVAVIPIMLGKPQFTSLVPLIAVIEYVYQNNKMMIYVENCLYG
jgi:transcriptional regulator with XRE-family HTH domain